MIISTVTPDPDAPFRILPVVHNWQSSFRTTYEFKTDILESGNGKEQRRAVRFKPRRSFDFTARYTGLLKYELDRFFNKALHKRCYAPEANLVIYTSAPMEEEDTSVNYLNPRQIDYPWLQSGMTVVLSDGWRMETRTVSGFNKNQLAFVEKNFTTFPAYTQISPARIGYVQQDPRTQRRTSTAGTLAFTFNLDPGFDTGLQTENEDVFYLGLREFFTKNPNWSDNPEVTHTFLREMVDYGYGRTAAFTPLDFPTRVLKSSYTAGTYEYTKAVIDFFMRMKGRNREFLMQSYEPDIPYYAIASGSNSILIQGQGFAFDYKDSTVFRRLVIRPKVGDDIHAEVDFVEALPDTNTSVIWLKESLPNVNLSPSNTFGINWVTVSRFATDRLDIDWITAKAAQFALTTQTLENFDV